MDGDNSSVNTYIGYMNCAFSTKRHDKPEYREVLSTYVAQRKTSRTEDGNSVPSSSIDGSKTPDLVSLRDPRSRLNSNASMLNENDDYRTENAGCRSRQITNEGLSSHTDVASSNFEKPLDDPVNSLSANPSEFMALLAPLLAQSSRSTCAENLAMHGAPEGTTIPFKGQQIPDSPSHLERSNKEFDPLPTTLLDKNSVDESNLIARCFSQEDLDVWLSKSAPQQPTDEQFCHEVQDEQSKKGVDYILDEKCYEDYGATAAEVGVQSAPARLDETATVVFLSSCDSPDAIYLRTSEMQSHFKTLKKEMMMHYKIATKNNPKRKLHFDAGVRCAAFVDGQWWRAEVIRRIAHCRKCVVSLLDAGCQETVYMRDMYPLEPKFDEYPRLTMRCCLDGVHPLNTAGWGDSVSNL